MYGFISDDGSVFAKFIRCGKKREFVIETLSQSPGWDRRKAVDFINHCPSDLWINGRQYKELSSAGATVIEISPPKLGDYVITYIMIVLSCAISLWYSSMDLFVITLFAVLAVTTTAGLLTNTYHSDHWFHPNNWYHWNNALSLIIFALVIYTKDPSQTWKGDLGALLMTLLFFVLPAGIGFFQVMIPYSIGNDEVAFFHVFFMFLIWLSHLLKGAFAHYMDYSIVVYVIFAILAVYSLYALVVTIRESPRLLIAAPVIYVMGWLALQNILAIL